MKRLTTYTGLLALFALLLAGCGKPQPEKSSETAAVEQDEHAHPSKGPHDGSLIELGKEEYHAELVHDDAAGSVTIYLLDGATAKVAVATDSPDVTINVNHDGKPEQFKLLAQPNEGDPAGKSSRFTSNDAELMEHLDEEHVDALLVVKIDGKSFNGKAAHSH